MEFEDSRYCILRNVLTEEFCKLITIQIELLKKKECHNKNIKLKSEYFNDSNVPNSYSIYSTSVGEALLLYLQEKIEEVTKVKLIPTYSFSRIYYKNSILHKHTDRPSCEYTVSICIKTDEIPWDFFIEDKNKEKITITLNEGDLLIFKGSELSHWRDKYNKNKHIQILLHYVDKDGDNKEYAYDKRPILGFKSNEC
jgi:hypothetical protein